MNGTCRCGQPAEILVHWRHDSDEKMCEKCVMDHIRKTHGGYYESTLLAKATPQERTRVA